MEKIEPNEGTQALSVAVSLVIYQNNISNLQQTFKCFRASADFLKVYYPQVVIHLYIIDNFPKDPWVGQTKQLIKENFTVTNSVKVCYIASKKNLGYGQANNIAITKTRTDYYLVINPDVFTKPDTLLNAVRFMQVHPEVGLLSPSVFGETGERHYLCRRELTLLILFLRGICPQFIQKRFQQKLDWHEMRNLNYEKEIYDIPSLTGCFMFFRSSVFKQLGGFRRCFFLYLEDADITRRALKISKTAYVPQVAVIHCWQRASYRSFKMRCIHILSALKYWWIWGGIF